tara:strand:+ start:424 stop:627 length:204 start_codon:yes stop_codon:yes gene_type:complete
MDAMTMAAITMFGVIPGAIVVGSIAWQLWDQYPRKKIGKVLQTNIKDSIFQLSNVQNKRSLKNVQKI